MRFILTGLEIKIVLGWRVYIKGVDQHIYVEKQAYSLVAAEL